MTACPDTDRLVAASAGEDVVALAHAAGCPGCRRAMRDHLAIRDLARDLPAPSLRPARRDAMAAELLARADHIEVARPLPPAVIVEPWIRRAIAAIAITAGALAAAAAALTALDPPPPAAKIPVVAVPMPDTAPETAPVRAVVHVGADGDAVAGDRSAAASPAPVTSHPAKPAPAAAHVASLAAGDGARYDRKSDGTIDRIALREGTLTIETSRATPPVVVTGTNVKVRAGSARLAARAAGGVVQQVQVFAGSVEIQTGAGVVIVTAGETWTWEPPAPTPAPVAAFRAGWDLLKAGQFARAAVELERAEADRGVGEDATYWAAIAWGRAGEAAKARAGLKRFLDRYPNGTRAGEAHLAIAHLLDDPAAIRQHLEAAAEDPDPRVKAAAEAALHGR